MNAQFAVKTTLLTHNMAAFPFCISSLLNVEDIRVSTLWSSELLPLFILLFPTYSSLCNFFIL